MNKTNLVPIVLFASLIFPSSAFGQSTLTPTVTLAPVVSITPKQGLFRQFQQNRKEMREDVKDNRQDVKEVRKEVRQELKATVAPDKTMFRRRLLENSQNGLLRSFSIRATALERYQKLILDRITQKLIKFPGNQDLLKAQASLGSDEQKTLWTNFKADVAKYEVSIKAIASSSDPKSLLVDLRTQAKKINEDLKAIRQFLVVNLRLVVKAK